MHAETMIAPTAAAHPTEQRLRMTYDEFQVWAADLHAEWVAGEAYRIGPHPTRHQTLLGFLLILVSSYNDLYRLGVVYNAIEMRTRPGNASRLPDLLFLAHAHRGRLTAGWLDGPADLVMEVISDASVTRDRIDKFHEYQAVGVREYWLIDSRSSQTQVDGYWLTPAGTYQAIVPDNEGRYHSHILPGFWFRAAWLWEEPLPDPLKCLMQIPQAAEALRHMLGGIDNE